LGLFKLCKPDLFNLGMIMIALGKAEFEYKISTQYDEDLIDLDIIKKKRSTCEYKS